jgi:hypothetical protein
MMDAEILGRVPEGWLNISTNKQIESNKLFRIEKPGGGNAQDVKKYTSNDKVPDKYKNQLEFDDLAKDPDQGGKILPKTRVEAMSGIEAVNIGAIQPPITRGPKGIEFYDGLGNPWDVKAPPSPQNNEFRFDASESGQSILDELRNKGEPPGYFINSKTQKPAKRGVILNSSFMNDTDHSALWEWLNTNLTQDELKRIIEVKIDFK